MNLLTAKTLLKRYGFDDTDPLVDWINAAKDQYLIEHDWPWRQVADAITLPAGTWTITPNAPALAMKSVFIEAGGQSMKLTQWDKSQALREIAARGGFNEYPPGTPSVYYVSTSSDGSQTVSFIPVPDVDYAATLEYQTKSTDLVNNTDILPGPSEGHYAVVLCAAYVALQAENEEARASTAQAQYTARVAALIDRYNDPSLDEPSQVVDVMGYGNYC